MFTIKDMNLHEFFFLIPYFFTLTRHSKTIPNIDVDLKINSSKHAELIQLVLKYTLTLLKIASFSSFYF